MLLSPLLAEWVHPPTGGAARADHVHNGIGNVVSADRYTPVGDIDGVTVYGAVYEFREREVKLSEADYSEAIAVMTALLEAS